MLRSLIITILFSLMGFTQACFATVSLSVNPVDGSSSLRFDKVPVVGAEGKQEIHIRVSSTNGGRYQVFQRILEPVMNEKGDTLNLQAIKTETLSNTNMSGTLYLQNQSYLTEGNQLLYSSSQNGASDSFIIRYALDQNLINAGGRFRGRLTFTVTDNVSSDQVTIDVLLDTSSNLKITVKGKHHRSHIHINNTDTSIKTADYVNVSFSGNSGREIRIYQDLETVPQNQSGDDLGDNLVQVDALGTDGLHVQGANSLGSNKTLIYSSNKDEDSFVIYFLINADLIQQQNAGSYKGRIKYIVETDQGKQEFPMDIHCDIPPVFTMNVTTPPGGVNFSTVLPNSPPQEKQVVVSVTSNLHKPYQVIEDIQSNMTNQQGKEFDSKYFTVQVQIPSGQKGQTDFVDFSPVKTGEYPVFSSDSKGSGSTFTVVYQLQGYSQMSPGNFLAPIRYSLNQK